jgi:hypothetical protein
MGGPAPPPTGRERSLKDTQADAEGDVLAKIAEMQGPHRAGEESGRLKGDPRPAGTVVSVLGTL